jgi:predicted DNA-binding transcriptional regulator AlpA
MPTTATTFYPGLLNALEQWIKTTQEASKVSGISERCIQQLINDERLEVVRDIIRERTKAGLSAARARGRNGGRRKKLTDKQLQIARQLYDAKTPVQQICETLGISRATFYRYIKPEQVGELPQEQALSSPVTAT